MSKVNDAFTFGNEEKEFTLLKFFNKDVIGLVELNLDLLYDGFKQVLFCQKQCCFRERVVNDILLGDLHNGGSNLEVVQGDLDEDLYRYLLLKRWTDQFHELLLNVLLVLGALS